MGRDKWQASPRPWDILGYQIYGDSRWVRGASSLIAGIKTQSGDGTNRGVHRYGQVLESMTRHAYARVAPNPSLGLAPDLDFYSLAAHLTISLEPANTFFPTICVVV